jgi:hypothetical protein
MDAAARQRLYELFFPDQIVGVDIDANLAERHLIEQLIEFLIQFLDHGEPDPDMEVDDDDCCEALEDDLERQIWGGESEDDEDNGDDEHQGEGATPVNTWTENVKYIRRPGEPKPRANPPMTLRISRMLIDRLHEQERKERERLEREGKNG